MFRSVAVMASMTHFDLLYAYSGVRSKGIRSNLILFA
jgi:hypothetical protein